MDPIAGMKPTGRRVSGPAYDLVELESQKGLKHTAICYHDEFVEHPSLLADLKEFGKFMEKPGVAGIVELSQKENKKGVYVYPTGTTWSLAEVVRSLADLGETAGIRAGLELAYLGAQMLQEAEEKAAEVELFNHGSLSPWSMLLRPDGQVAIIGYGFPQVEVLDFLEDESLMPKEDAFRYAPPERLADEGEDLSSDLFSLALIALELMTGRPVYDGLINDIRQQATRAEGAYRLYKWRNQIPEPVREALGRALKFDPDSRYPSATEFIYAVHDLLGTPDIEGYSLHEAMRKVRQKSQGGNALMGGRTAALTREELQRLAAEMEEDDAPPPKLAPPKRPRPGADQEPEDDGDDEPQRWGKVSREGRRAPHKRERPTRGGGAAPESPQRSVGRAAEPARAASPSQSTAGRAAGGRGDDLRDRLRRDRSSGPPSREARGTAREERGGREERAPKADDLRSSLKDRLRQSLGNRRPSDEPEPEPTPAPPPEPKEEPVTAPAPSAPEEQDMAGDEEQVTGAAALLARLRSSAGRRASLPPTGPDPTATARPTAPEPPPARAEPEPERARPTAPPRTSSGNRRSAKHSSGNLDNDERVAFEIHVDGLKPRRTKLRLGDPLADAADRLGRALLALPTDLSGALRGWYRLEQNGEWFAGHETTDVLDVTAPVDLAFVPNRVVPMQIEVRGVDPVARFQAPVGTAVPVGALVHHLVELLGLPEGEWGMYVGGERVEPLQILEDYEPDPGFQLVVKR